MTTSREYRQFARQCTEWAAETDTSEARNAFLDLASDWTLAALCVDRATKKEASPTGKNHLSWRLVFVFVDRGGIWPLGGTGAQAKVTRHRTGDRQAPWKS